MSAGAEQLNVSVTGSGNVIGIEFGEEVINCPDGDLCSHGGAATMTLTATADNGHEHISWGGACAGATGSVCTLGLSETSASIVASAHFQPISTLTLSVATAGSGVGTVTGSGGINCPTQCTTSAVSGTSLTLSAAAASTDSTFSGWSGACSGTGSCTVVLSENTAVTANFQLVDADGDGVADSADMCGATPMGESVDVNGCSASQHDADGDGVPNTHDSCPSTPAGEPVDVNGCSNSQNDTDGDGVANANDFCPSTPAGESVDVNGCSNAQSDTDGDGVANTNDSCPATPTGESVDVNGCSSSQSDTDDDGVANTGDSCPATPAGESVDVNGCSNSQTDTDGDGVANASDSCPATPTGESVDVNGCSNSQSDTDGDGVANASDSCPATPTGEPVDVNGCSDSQNDADGDGVNDAADQCPATPPGSTADENGCISEQLDTDQDGISDADDNCPNTDSSTATNAEGCSEVQQFGDDLGTVPGLSGTERVLASRIDEVCPQLIKEGSSDNLTEGQGELRAACSRLKNKNTTDEQAATALKEISITELASQADFSREMFTNQYRQLGNRINSVNTGGGRGVSVSGLNLTSGEQTIPGQVVQSLFQGLLGMGASDDAFADFGKLGIFVQGDLDFGERDDTALESGYDFDSWNLSIGSDYRFSDTFFAGASVALGETEVDFNRQGGDSDISSVTLSVYAGWQLTDNWFLDALLSYGQTDFDTTRHVRYVDVGGDFESTQLGDTEGEQVFIGINTGYMSNVGSWRFGPTASLTYLEGSIDGFTEYSSEDSSGAWNFTVDDQEFESLRFSMGVQADYIINTSFGVLVPGIRVAYVYEAENGAESIAMRLANNPYGENDLESGQVIVTTDGRDSSFLDASFNLSGQFIMGISGYVGYHFYSAYDDYSQEGVTVGLRWDKPY